ncbi:MAG: a-factor receptor [Thelocarpon superellum]|nr:MAG: a-factor receptor [Thelocarpon superellum]
MDLSLDLDFDRSPQAVLLPILAVLSVALSLPPFAWHLKNRNVAACSLIFWIILTNVFVFTNALIWPTDNLVAWWDGVGLCDVEVKLTWASSVGATGALAAIMRNLARVMDVDRATLIPTQAQRRRQLAVDLILCYGFPIYVMAVDFIVQSGRYYIFTISGCTPAVDASWPSIFLIFIWAPILCLVESYYCVLLIYRLRKYRQQFAQILTSSNSNLNKSRFLRLFLIALTLLLTFLPLQFYILYLNLSYPRHPYNWDEVHGTAWSDIIKVPTGGQVAFDRWIRVASGFMVFLFFGMGHDAMDMYRRWLVSVGMATYFPSLTQPPMQTANGFSGPSTFGSLTNRAKGMLSKISNGTTITSMSDSQSSPRNSLSIDTAMASPSNPEESFGQLSDESPFDGPIALARPKAALPASFQANHANSSTATLRVPGQHDDSTVDLEK